jgi:hypothetical protein
MTSEDFTFSFKPRMMGPGSEFKLSKDALDWSIGMQSGRVSYPMIRHIRLGYKPTNMGTGRFIAEIWAPNAPKLVLNSISARSMIDTEDLGKQYGDFLRELHRRIAAAKGECVFEVGLPAWRWWPSAIVGVFTFFAIAYIVVQGVAAGQYAVAGAITLLGAWFLWQIWNIVTRNRPRTYLPDNIPGDILPAARE